MLIKLHTLNNINRHDNVSFIYTDIKANKSIIALIFENMV